MTHPPARPTRRGPLIGLAVAGVVAVGVPAIAATLNPALVATDIAATALPAGFAGELRNTQGENCVFDSDGDGVRDVFLSTHGQGWRLLKGQPGGTFAEVERFPATDRHGCAVGDFGGVTAGGRYTGPDGRPDIYASVGACQGTCTAPFPNELWLQRPDGTYLPPGQNQLLGPVEDGNEPNAGSVAAKHFGLADEHGRGREPLALDVNRDGLLDIFLGNDQGVLFKSPNRLYLNRGGSFEEQALPVPAEVGSVCSAAGDFDADGWVDLVNCADEGQGDIQIYRNDGGTLTEVAAQLGVGAVGDARDAELADIDGDGKLDLVLARHSKIELRLNRGNAFGTVDFSRAVDGGTDLAIGDADGDRLKDVYAVMWNNAHGSGKGTDLLLRNTGAPAAGGGWGLEETPIPTTKVGNGDTAQALPNWNGTNRAAFLVNNGKFEDNGPYQLIFMVGPSTGAPEEEGTPTTPTTPAAPTSPTTQTTPTTPSTPPRASAWCKRYPKLRTGVAKQLKAAKRARVRAVRAGSRRAKLVATKRVKAIRLKQTKAAKRWKVTCRVSGRPGGA